MWAYFVEYEVIILKCKYKYCKHGGEVAKEDATKVGSSYYHKDCYNEKQLKQEIEEYWNENFPSAQPMILKKVINQLINDKNYECEYVQYVIKYIKTKNKPINNPFGLINYCDSLELKNIYKKYKINLEFNKIKNVEIKYNPIDNNEIKFKYKNNNKRITDLI